MPIALHRTNGEQTKSDLLKKIQKYGRISTFNTKEMWDSSHAFNLLLATRLRIQHTKELYIYTKINRFHVTCQCVYRCTYKHTPKDIHYKCTGTHINTHVHIHITPIQLNVDQASSMQPRKFHNTERNHYRNAVLTCARVWRKVKKALLILSAKREWSAWFHWKYKGNFH